MLKAHRADDREWVRGLESARWDEQRALHARAQQTCALRRCAAGQGSIRERQARTLAVHAYARQRECVLSVALAE